MRNIFCDWAAEDFNDLSNYIPFMGSGESDMFLLNLTTEEVLAYQPMIQIVGELRFRSIDSMLECLIECHKKGVFKVDPQQGLDTDYHAYRAIQQAYL
jgi:hypothetical protein